MTPPGVARGGRVVSGPVSRGRSSSRRLAVLRELFAAVPVPVAYLTGPELVFEFANDAYRRLVGRQDLVGRAAGEALPELAAQGRTELLAAVLESGQPFQGYETELLVPRGGESGPEQVFVECLYQPVRSADGPADGLLLLVSDVTAQVLDRRAQEALATQLAATQERYRTLFETLPQGVIYYDTNGLILGANPAACHTLGLDEEELITWPLVGSTQAVHEDGSVFQASELPVAVALRTGEVVTDVVMGVPHGRTGEQRWLRVTAVPDARDADGRPQRAYAMFRDLTRERRAAAALREGAELMGRLREANVIGVVVNGEDHVHDANDAFLDVVGYTRDDVEAVIAGRSGTQTAPAPAPAVPAPAAQAPAAPSSPPLATQAPSRADGRDEVVLGLFELPEGEESGPEICQQLREPPDRRHDLDRLQGHTGALALPGRGDACRWVGGHGVERVLVAIGHGRALPLR